MNKSFQFSDGLYVTLVSMAAVFIVLVIIALCIFVMSKLFGSKAGFDKTKVEIQEEDEQEYLNELEVVVAIVSSTFMVSYEQAKSFNIKKIN